MSDIPIPIEDQARLIRIAWLKAEFRFRRIVSTWISFCPTVIYALSLLDCQITEDGEEYLHVNDASIVCQDKIVMLNSDPNSNGFVKVMKETKIRAVISVFAHMAIILAHCIVLFYFLLTRNKNQISPEESNAGIALKTSFYHGNNRVS